MLIQVALLAGVVGTVIVFVRYQAGAGIRASKRLAFFAFLGLNVYAVLRPEDVTRVAKLLGVGRGTDLLLYMLIVTFVFVVLHLYLRLRESERRLTELARAVAISTAEAARPDLPVDLPTWVGQPPHEVERMIPGQVRPADVGVPGQRIG